MPRVMRAISQDYLTVTRRIVEGVAKDFLRQTDFKEKFEIIHDNEISGGSKQLKNLFNLNSEKPVRSNFNTYLFIDMKENYLEDHINVNRWEKTYISDTFRDDEHGIRLRPQFVTAQVEATFKVRCSSLSALNRWTNNLRYLHGQTILRLNHEVDYEYDIPPSFIDFIGEAYGMIEDTYPDGQTMSEYLRKSFGKGVQKRASINGEHVDLICVEKQSAVVGLVTNEFFYNSKEIQDGIYEVTVEYRFEYKKPIAFNFNIPAIIRNKRIPDRFVDAWVPKIERPTYAEGEEIPLYMATHYHEELNPTFHLGDGGSRLLEWDDWFPTDYAMDYQTVCIAPVQVDPNEPTAVFNVMDIPDKYLPEAVKSYLSNFKHNKGHYYLSLVAIELWAVGEEEVKLGHTMDESLNITTYRPMNPRHRHFIRFSLMKDLAKYNAQETAKMLKMPEQMLPLFKLYDPEVEITQDSKRIQEVLNITIRPGAYKNIPSLLYNPGNAGITPRSFTYWLRKLPHTNQTFLNLRPITGRLVTDFRIRASRR